MFQAKDGQQEPNWLPLDNRIFFNFLRFPKLFLMLDEGHYLHCAEHPLSIPHRHILKLASFLQQFRAHAQGYINTGI